MAAPVVPLFDDDRGITKKRCIQCGGTYLLIFFHPNRGSVRNALRTTADHRPRCIGCEDSDRMRAAQANRYRKKARDARRRHAKTFITRGIITDTSQLETEYDWSLAQMAHDIEHASRNGCPYCWVLFSTMPNGLADITLDIVDPDLPPY